MPLLRDGIHVVPVGPIGVNCYLVMPHGSSKLRVIDPGDDAGEIAKAAKAFAFKSAEILLTHAHADHIAGIADLIKEIGPAQVFVHPDDAKMYASPKNHFLPLIAPAKDLPPCSWPPPAEDGMETLHTPGHSKGGSCYYFPSLNALFSGDTLFRGSIGRTDFPGGDFQELMASIKDKILALPDKVEVFPGHGPASTIGIERDSNPYICGQGEF